MLLCVKYEKIRKNENRQQAQKRAKVITKDHQKLWWVNTKILATEEIIKTNIFISNSYTTCMYYYNREITYERNIQT